MFYISSRAIFHCSTMAMIVVTLLFLCLPAQAEETTFPKGSPEDVVNSLMKFDFNGGKRDNQDTLSEWDYLTTHGEPESSNISPYWNCTIWPIIRSYKILGKETISPIKVRVIVEVEVVALSVAAKEWLSKNVNLCYWPELSATIHNSVTNEVYIFKRPLSSTELIGKIVDDKLSGNTYSEKLGGYIPISKAYRKWQYKVDVLLNEGFSYEGGVATKKTLWRIPTEKLPYPLSTTRAEIEHQQKTQIFLKSAINICTGLLEPPDQGFMKRVCPPVRYPDEELSLSQSLLEMLNTIQGEQK